MSPGIRVASILAGAGLPMSFGAVVHAAIGLSSRNAPVGRDWPSPLQTWMIASFTLGFVGAAIGTWSGARLERESPIVEGVVLALLPAGLAALGSLAWGLAIGLSWETFGHAGALFLPPLIAAATSAWVVTRRA